MALKPIKEALKTVAKLIAEHEATEKLGSFAMKKKKKTKKKTITTRMSAKKHAIDLLQTVMALTGHLPPKGKRSVEQQAHFNDLHSIANSLCVSIFGRGVSEE